MQGDATMNIKSLFIAMITLFLVSGCGKEIKHISSSSPASEKVTPSAEGNQQEYLKKLVTDFYNLVVKKDLVKISKYVSDNHLKRKGITKEQFAQSLFVNKKQETIEIKSFEIKELKKYDDTHYYVLIGKKAVVKGQEAYGEDEWMLIKENGKWKLDGTLIVKSTPLKIQENKPIYITGKDFILNEMVNGYSLEFTLINFSAKNGYGGGHDILFGTNKELAKATLVTSKGVFFKNFDEKFVFPIDGEGKMYIPFKGAKGTPEALVFDEIYPDYRVDGNGNPKGGKLDTETFYFGELTTDRMKKIGQELFKNLATVDLAKNEKEADEIFNQTLLDGSDSNLAKGLKSGLEYGKYKNVEVSFLSEEAKYDQMYHYIVYKASIENKLVDQEGKVTKNNFNITTTIYLDPKDGLHKFGYFGGE